MASQTSITLLLSLSLSLSLLLPAALAGGAVICEELPQELCAFAISSLGKRCVVESYRWGGGMRYQCRTSEVDVGRMVDWVETDECVADCGADRRMVGISSDALLDPQFSERLCSPECYENCPNIIDLYYNLAAGEGVVLSHHCEVRRTNPVRAMAELQSSSSAAAAPSATTEPSVSTSSSSATAAAPISGAATPQSSTTAAAPNPATSEAATAPSSSKAAPSIPNAEAAAPSDVSEFSIDASFDELDADPVPVPARPPSSLFEDEGEDADFV